jgi:hypothetical protein
LRRYPEDGLFASRLRSGRAVYFATEFPLHGQSHKLYCKPHPFSLRTTLPSMRTAAVRNEPETRSRDQRSGSALNASALPGAPIRRGDGPSGELPSAHPDVAAGPSGPEPTRKRGHPIDDTQGSRQIRARAPGHAFRLLAQEVRLVRPHRQPIRPASACLQQLIHELLS